MAHPVVLCFRQVELLSEESVQHSGKFAGNHDEGIWRCFRQILELSPDHRAEEVASLPLRHDGLGLKSAQRIHPATHWASWADALAMIHQRHNAISDTTVGTLESNAESDSIRCLLDCARRLEKTGFEMPDWTDLAEGKVAGDEGEDDPCPPKIGWQKQAANSVEECFFSNTVLSSLGDSERALALTQRNLLASAPFVCFPSTAPGASIRSRFVFCSFVASVCPFPCVSAVAGVAVLLTPLAIIVQLAGTRGFRGEGSGLSSQQARVCREAGARVRTNTFIRDMDLGMHDTFDGRRLEVLADGLPLHGGAQLAIDTTMVSPLHRNGVALRGAASRPGVALKLARRRKELTYPELASDGGRARLVVLAAEVGNGPIPVRAGECQGEGPSRRTSK